MTTDTIKTFFRAFVLFMMSLTVQTALGAFVQPEKLPTDSWANHQATSFSSGSGTQADPWVITSPAELAFLAYQVTNNKSINGVACVSAYYSLQADLNLKDHIWVPIGNLSTGDGKNFKGNFEGNGHVIKNMMLQWEVTNSTQAIGLFSTILNGAVVQNLVLDNAYIYNKVTTITNPTADRLVAPFAGAVQTNTKIQNIIVKNTKVEVTEAYNQNSKWMLFGGFIAKALNNSNTYNLTNIYVDVDIDITKLTVNKTSAVYASLFVPEFYGNIKTAPRNIYLDGDIKASANLTLVGPVFGTKLPSSSTYKDTWQLNSSNTFQYTEDGGKTWTNLTTKDAGGTSVTAFDQASFNSYVEENDLCTWESTNGDLTLKQIPFPTFTKTSNITTDGTNRSYNCEVSLAEGTDDYQYKWTVDGVVQSSTGSTCSVEAKDKALECKVEITNDSGYSYTINFTIDPLYYSIDLYADEFGGGDGTASSPYIINNDMQLAKLAHDVNNGNKYSGTYFKLGADITLDKALWMPIGQCDNYDNRFGGKFDGKGNTISNMHILWEPKVSKWVYWGLFSYLKGTSDKVADYAVITNFIVDNAKFELKPGFATSGSGVNIGVVCAELAPYSEVSNIIVRNTAITDDDQTYTLSASVRIGGVVGNLENANNCQTRLYNLSSDAAIKVFKNANTSNKEISIGGFIGQMNYTPNDNEPHIAPINIYAHGAAIDTDPKTNTNFKFGPVVGKLNNANATINEEKCYYLASPANATNTNGTQLVIADAYKFQAYANEYLIEKNLDDREMWSYNYDEGQTKITFSFGSITLTGEKERLFEITADQEGTYTCYISSDNETWEEIKNGETSVTDKTVSVQYKDYMKYVYESNG